MSVQKNRRRVLSIVAWLCLANGLLAQTSERFQFAEPHLGTIVELTIYAREETAANDAARAAYARIKELDRIFSDYKSDSEAMRLCEMAGKGLPTKISPELYEVLKRSLVVSRQTDGAFDVTVGPMVQLWRQARKKKQLPSEADIMAAKQLVDWKSISLREEDRTAELTRAGTRLDFGGIAKCFIAQDVSRLLRKLGFPQSLVIVAGDIVAGEAPPGAEVWKIAIAPLKGVAGAPGQLVRLKNQAISTSGDAFQFVEIDGKRYSHIVDTRTGLGVTQTCSVTVISSEGSDADAYATAFCILSPERSLDLISQLNDVEALIVLSTPDGIKTFESNGFHNLILKP